jgi:ElaB/YqjD/DUF883 family membrane-anchored ribosome-binding protein
VAHTPTPTDLEVLVSQLTDTNEGLVLRAAKVSEAELAEVTQEASQRLAAAERKVGRAWHGAGCVVAGASADGCCACTHWVHQAAWGPVSFCVPVCCCALQVATLTKERDALKRAAAAAGGSVGGSAGGSSGELAHLRTQLQKKQELVEEVSGSAVASLNRV